MSTTTISRREALKRFGFLAVAAAPIPITCGDGDIKTITAKAVQADEKLCKGQVFWSADPPQYVSFQAHKFSIIDAIEHASVMLKRDLTKEHEIIVVGDFAKAIVSSLPQMLIKASHDGLHSADLHGRPILGELCSREVIYDPKFLTWQFVVQIKERKDYVEGCIVGANYYSTENIPRLDLDLAKGLPRE